MTRLEEWRVREVVRKDTALVVSRVPRFVAHLGTWRLFRVISTRSAFNATELAAFNIL